MADSYRRYSGSPPRSRGRLRTPSYGVPVDGITPAFAGKASNGMSFRLPSRDHPRVRGEGVYETRTEQHTSGSPPRSRGRPPPAACGNGAVGITPAFAGKAVYPYQERSEYGDHPRVRGEGALRDAMVVLSEGSPPRSRGRLPHGALRAVEGGITPAFAGKAVSSLRRQMRTRDHPRVRGEGMASGIRRRARLGSPPRSRGRLPSFGTRVR